MKPPILLRIYLRDQLTGVKQFAGGQVVIGANEDVGVRLEGGDVAPLHALVEERESGFYISDLGSSAGTYVNGSKTLDEKLESGDEIRVGDYKIQFFIGVPKPASPPMPPPPPPTKNPPTPIPAPTPTVTPTRLAAPTNEAEPTFKGKAKEDFSNLSNEVVKPKPKTRLPDDSATVAHRPAVPKVPVRTESHKTLAPPSAIKDAKEILKPGKGAVVEVVVTWKERVLAARHFDQRCEVTLGSDPSSDLVVPVLGPGTKIPLVKIESGAIVRFSSDMTGELIQEKGSIPFKDLAGQNRIRSMGGVFELDLQQGEMIRLGIHGNLISIFVRYVPATPKPIIAPVLDLTASESTGVVLAVVIAAIWSLYMAIYSPSSLENEALLEEPIRKATIVFKSVKKKEVVPVVEETPKEKQVVRVVEKPKEKVKPAIQSPGASGKMGEVKPAPVKAKPKEVVSSVPQGGAIKTSPKEGAQAKTVKQDPTKMGLLGVFGKGGAQKQLAKSFSGEGELTGMANEATGYAGNAETRAGDGLGSKLKNVGGGKGTATVGIAGLGTKGRGTGNYGYGTGGIGTKGSVDIDIGGQEAEVSGSIDREAIRRIVLANRAAIRSCYDRALQRKPDLYGKVVVEWDIEDRGRVTSGRVKSSSMNDGGGVARCVLGVIKGLTFPEPPSNQVARVAYPFLFSSQ